jgi:dTDP-4-dehydrorhamnose reductase
MKILVLGANGMLGHVMLRTLAADRSHDVTGTVRSAALLHALAAGWGARLISGIDVVQPDALIRAFADVRPDLVVNCVGLVKQLADARDPLHAIPVNALLPHRLAALCQVAGARLVHVSTDCVFAGSRGHYREEDAADAEDLYGRSKLLGEVDYPHALTLRTSIIGPELSGNHGLLAWFLSQPGTVRGYRRAIFSGLPTVELATVIRDRVLPRPDLHGLYHVASSSIDKYELLRLIAAAYARSNGITPDDVVAVDRSLDGSRFAAATGYVAAPWPELVRRMHESGQTA